MNGSTENTAHDASERPGRPERLVDLPTAQRMLTLVRQVISDLLAHGHRLAEMRPELDRLDRQRRTLVWPERQRRYQLQDEANKAERLLHEASAELEVLGVSLLDADMGRVGFPTLVNDKLAFFSWRPGEDRLQYWHFAGENVRRTIPPTWMKAADVRLLNKS